MRRTLFLAILAGLALSVRLTHPALTAEFFASTAAQVTTALSQAQPGDVVTMTNGTWTNQSITFTDNGTQANPITLRAQSPGGVILNGTSKLTINGDWLVVDGLRFEGGTPTGGSVISFSGSSQHSRLTNSAIIDYNPPAITTEVDWVTINGQDNRVDHSYFKNHNSIGQTLEIRHTAGTPDRHLVDNNYFADRPVGNGNGWETIRIGLSGVATSSSFSVVENNLFERVDGENEAISNKSSHNTYRHNTFRDVRATLTLRHGNDATVEGNFFLGENQDGSGGVRVIGERHKIINNYFANIDDGGGAAIAINRGEIDAEPTGYQHVKDGVIAHNTFVDTLGAMIQFNAGASTRPLLAENMTIANNLFRSNGSTIFTGTEGTGWTWEGNIAFGGSLGPKAGAPGITVVNPQLTLGPDGLWRPGAASPVVNAAVGNYGGLVPNDMDGQARIGIGDVGADEVSNASIVRRPLVASDVGPSWLFNRPSPTRPGFGPGGCAIQAEDFTYIADPDGDGNVWTTLVTPDALGGQAIGAPAGDRVDPPGETHDSLAVYELMFETPGVYTAFYRSRGLDSAKNSIYSPDGFDADPDNPQTLSENGAFTWVKDAQTFEITAANVGVPLEFRLGMREELSQLDALVLSLDAFMSAEELDAIFEIRGDYDGDGQVDGHDFLLWQQTITSRFDLRADGNGNRVIDGGDLAIWRDYYGLETVPPVGPASAVPEPAAGVLALGGLLFALAARRYHTPFKGHFFPPLSRSL